MKPENIENAIIKNATIETESYGVLTVWLELAYEGSGQSFGGHALYLPKSFTKHSLLSPAGHFMWRVMEIADVTRWDKLSGKTVRVSKDKAGLGGIVNGIGHIVKNDWFFPSVDMGSL